jgi:kinesin family protein 3/17
MLLQQLLEQVQPLIRRDCNYSSLEKIRRESSWDEDNGFWKIPEPIIIKTSLPVGQELGCPRPLLLPSQLPTLQRVREPGFSLQAVGAVDTWPQLSDTLGS